MTGNTNNQPKNIGIAPSIMNTTNIAHWIDWSITISKIEVNIFFVVSKSDIVFEGK